MSEADPRIAAIVEQGRRTRRAPSKLLWIAGIACGLAGVLGFVLLWVAEPSAARAPQQPITDRSLGFASGLAIGLAAGLLIGYFAGRKRP